MPQVQWKKPPFAAGAAAKCHRTGKERDKVSFRRARTKVRIWVGASEQQSQRCAQNRGDKQNTNDAPVQLKSQ
jgi:hypothetical protein